MKSVFCPSCQQVNAAEAWRCKACDARLGDEDTEPGALLRLGDLPDMPEIPHAPHTRHSTGAIWLDDLEPPTAAMPLHDTEAAPLAITLRPIEAPPAPPAIGFNRRALPKARAAPAAPAVGQLVQADLELPFPPGSASRAHSGVRAQLAADPTARAAAKAAKRAAVRRARLGHAANGVHTASTPPAAHQVLVLDADDSTRETLATLLGAFGFEVHATTDVGQALAMSGSHAFVAAFIDVPFDGTDSSTGIDLCQHLKQLDVHPGHDPATLVLVSAKLRPVARVRAKLAGCDGFLVKPVQRGDVARVLEASGVALPSDARRG